jgi:hypothetical protein
MSENEFELYLSLLSRFLRLKPDQRLEISDELRSHLEDRLNDLVAQGLSREQAVRRALEEFGDAASLADHFTQLAQGRRRRFIMRCTLSTIAATAAAVLVAMAFWPVDRALQGPARAVADNSKEAATAATTEEARKAEVERILDSTTLTIEFNAAPLSDVIGYLSEKLNVDSHINPNVNRDTLVTLNITRRPVSARTVLELALEQASAGYTIRDGIVYVTAEALHFETQVYNCRDLLASLAPLVPPQPRSAVDPYQPTRAESLVAVITGTVQPATWGDVGGLASIRELDGLLIVKQSQQVHREIRELLKLIQDNLTKGR